MNKIRYYTGSPCSRYGHTLRYVSTKACVYCQLAHSKHKRVYMPNVKVIYGCQQYDQNRLCRYDRRAIDRRCDGCPRTTDRAYLESMSLWVHGVSHIDKACSTNGDGK